MLTEVHALFRSPQFSPNVPSLPVDPHGTLSPDASLGSPGSGRFSGFLGLDLESLGSGVLWGGPRLGFVWCFSHGWTGLWREGPDRVSVFLITPVCPGHVLSPALARDADHGPLAEVVTVGCLHQKETSFLPSTCAFCKEVTIHSPPKPWDTAHHPLEGEIFVYVI